MGVEVNATVEATVSIVPTVQENRVMVTPVVDMSGGGGAGLTNEVKEALLQIARKVVYVDASGQTYYDALYSALYPLSGITAVYTQSGTIYTTDTLSDLIPDLVVTATYGDGNTETVPSTDYTLSGTLEAGTSTITVTYEGFTATFNVTVTEVATLVSITAVYTQSGTVYTSDTLDSLKSDLVVTAHYSDSSDETVPSANYTLSGTLEAGTSTITAAYGGKTDTFTVTVSAVTLSSISAVYTQSGTVYDTDSLESLEDDLVVTATYSDTSTETVPSTDYTLSGTLTVGTSTITASYGGKTDTFSVTVSSAGRVPIYSWDLKTSMTDTVGGITATTTGSQDSSGLHFTGTSQYADFGAVYDVNRTYEIDVVSHSQATGGGLTTYGRFLMVDTDSDTSSGGAGFMFSGSKRPSYNNGKAGYAIYLGNGWATTDVFSTIPAASADNDYNDAFFDGKTIQMKVASNGYVTIRCKTIGADDSTYVDIIQTSTAFKSYTNGHIYIGSSGANTDRLFYATFSGLRVYAGVD